ncbi:TetR/AcrR family transcriptional regulator [Lacinutrix sp. Hel_I_90]|uniref:TetR/AcrR family transcriptional regulator n=1 Tax=Lacinutrix sp. Hel_I_90 TaxID=1249999 RepID=UPI0005C95091|nr:TetR/AcrR family transcriptional regulator [Lacinutrix sp. Hel_I_90]
MKFETRKQQIIKTAAKLFKKKGYSAVTMRDLATEMGIKAASLYNHISSKQEILKIIIISLAEEFTIEMNNIRTSEGTSLDKLNKIVTLHIKTASENTYEMAALNNDWMHLEEQRDYYLKLRDVYEENFRNIIKSGIANQELKEENVEVMLFSMLSTLRSLYLWIPKKEDLNIEELKTSLSNVLIHGFNK